MPRHPDTRQRIVDAASRLFYKEGIRAVSMDAVAEKADVTKKTLYYHFASKDDLVAAYLTGRDQPNLKQFVRWFEEEPGPIWDKVQAIFTRLAVSARHPKWRGCGFLRTVGELANMPGHPAMKISAEHKKKVEHWLSGMLDAAGADDAALVSRQVVVLLDGVFSTMLVHRDPSYANAAGAAAAALVKSSMPAAGLGQTGSDARR